MPRPTQGVPHMIDRRGHALPVAGPHDMDRLRRRRFLRLPGYDYSQPGAYFVTICTHRRGCVFGEIRQSDVHLSDIGHFVADCWKEIPRHFPHLSLDEWIVMPNHIHGILIISEYPIDGGARHAASRPAREVGGPVGSRHASPLPTRNFRGQGARHASPLPTVIAAFKSAAARRVNEHLATPGAPVWQRNYYEHVVRNQRALHRIRQYIAANPERWPDDAENPNRRRRDRITV